jgi:putative flippase GtrA
MHRSDESDAPMNRLIELFRKYQDVISYLFFGGCSTAVNVLSYGFFSHVVRMGTVVSSSASWIVTVLFVYVTNRKWVFHSEAEGAGEIFREFVYFMVCRLATGVLDVAIMWFSVDVLGLNDLVMKLVSNVIVIVLNFVASKLIIFKRK